MKYTKEGKPILRRLSAKSSFRLVYETMHVLGFNYEWNEGMRYPFVLWRSGRCQTFSTFESTIECINMNMEEAGYIKPIERI